MDSKALATIPEGAGTDLTNLNMKQIMYIGQIMYDAKMFSDITSLAAAQVKVMAGQELGLSPFQAMNSFHIIKGRATMAANLMASKVQGSSKYRYRVLTLTNEVCVISIQQLEGAKWVNVGESRFDTEDAKDAGTQNMGRFPRNMLFARAISNAVRWYCPDVFNQPVYVPEELPEIEAQQAIEDGEIRTADEIEAASKARRENARTAGTVKKAKVETAPIASEPEAEDTHESTGTDKLPSDEDVAKGLEGAQAFDEAVKGEDPAPETQTDRPHEPRQLRQIFAIFTEMGITKDEEIKAIFKGLTGLDSRKELTFTQAVDLIDTLNSQEITPEALRVMYLED